MLRVALVTWVFPLSGTWDTLMVIYPVTWSFMIVAMLVSYFHRAPPLLPVYLSLRLRRTACPIGSVAAWVGIGRRFPV